MITLRIDFFHLLLFSITLPKLKRRSFAHDSEGKDFLASLEMTKVERPGYGEISNPEGVLIIDLTGTRQYTGSETGSKMRIAVMGTGAVGGYFGAKLAAAGHDVGFVARGAQLAALKLHGLTIASHAGNFSITHAVFTDEPAEIGVVDLVLFCVKSYDTLAAAEKIRPLVGAQTQILSLQNGIDNPDKIASLWGPSRILAGVVYIAAAIERPAVILHSAGGRIVFGIIDGRDTTRAGSLQDILSAAQIPSEFTPEIRTAQWRKLLWNAPFCAISCLVRATVEDILGSDSLRQLAIDCMTEVREAAATKGIWLEETSIADTLAFSQGLGSFKPSMLQDLEAGKPLEYQAFNGIVADLLNKTGTVNRVFAQTLSYIDARIRSEIRS